jgi:hypothetical protein
MGARLQKDTLGHGDGFVVLYLLCIASYLRSETPIGKRTEAAVLLVLLVSTLGGAGPRALYPVVVLALSVAASLLRDRGGTARRRRSPGRGDGHPGALDVD